MTWLYDHLLHVLGRGGSVRLVDGVYPDSASTQARARDTVSARRVSVPEGR